MERFIPEPGCQWLAGGDKENILCNNTGKLYDFPYVYLLLLQHKKMNVQMDKVQKGMEKNEHCDLRGNETLGTLGNIKLDL